jgi:signal transduction histidine kinase
LYLSSQIRSSEHYNKISILRYAELLSSRTDVMILGLASGMRGDYDEITALQVRLLETANDLRAIPAATGLIRTLEAKVDLVEKFKSLYAVFRNSVRALPVLHRGLREDSLYEAVPPDVKLAEADLEWLLFENIAAIHDNDIPGLQSQLADLETMADFDTIAAIGDWEYLAAHIDKLFAVAPELKRITERLHAQPVSAMVAPLQDLVNAEFYDRLWWSRLAQYCLFALVVILLGLAVTKVVAVWRHKTELESRVVRRTSALVAANAALQREIAEKEAMQSELVQAQKLESIGQLAAGIAHEINTPIQYVGDNTRFLEEAFVSLSNLLRDVKGIAATGAEGRTSEIETAFRTADADFLLHEIPRAITDSIEGTDRVTKIVRALKEFAHPTREKTSQDLNRAIESTATVARNEWRYVANLELELDQDLPQVPCVLSELNQVILNLIINASHAIGSKLGDDRGDEKGTITVRTIRSGDFAEIQVEDSGTGVPAEFVDRIFDPFFTTKEVGRGTGQGLAIAHNVIAEKHGGTISVKNIEGSGARFTIRLPLADIHSVSHDEPDQQRTPGGSVVATFRVPAAAN